MKNCFILLLLCIPANALNAAYPKTPSGVIQRILKGLENADPIPLVDSLAQTDKGLANEIYHAKIADIRQRLRLSDETTKHWNDYSWQMADAFLYGFGLPLANEDFQIRAAYKYAFIKDQWIQGDYAEVDVILPLLSKGPSFFRLILFKEAGGWKFAPMGSLITTMSFMVNWRIDSFSASDFTEFPLYYTYDSFPIKKRGIPVLKSYKLPEEIRQFYREQAATAPEFLLLWASAGDKEGTENLMESEYWKKADGDLQRYGQLMLKISHDRSAKINPLLSLPADRQWEFLSSPWLPNSALLRFVSRFANDKTKIVEPMSRVAAKLVSEKKYKEASAIYQDIFSSDSHRNDIILAKQRYAELLWGTMKEFAKAKPYLDQLAAIGRFPLNIPYDPSQPIPDITYFRQTGLKDFALTSDGKYVDLLLQKTSVDKNTADRLVHTNKVLRYNQACSSITLASDVMFHDERDPANAGHPELNPADILFFDNGDLALAAPAKQAIYLFDSQNRLKRKIERPPTSPNLRAATDMAIDSKGRIYLSLQEEQYIAVLSPQGKMIRRIVEDAKEPKFVALDGRNNLYVAQRDLPTINEEIVVYSPTGDKIASFRTKKPPKWIRNGQVRDLAVTTKGDIFVRVERYLQHYDIKGNLLDYYEGDERLLEGSGLAPDNATNSLFVLHKNEILRYDKKTLRQITKLPYFYAHYKRHFTGDQKGVIRGYDYDHGIFSFNPTTGETIVSSTTARRQGTSEALLVVNEQNRLWELTASRLLGVNPDNAKFLELTNPGIPNWAPVSLDQDSAGYIYIASASTKKLMKYTKDWAPISELDLSPYIINSVIQKIRISKNDSAFVLTRAGEIYIFRKSLRKNILSETATTTTTTIKSETLDGPCLPQQIDSY